MITLETLLKELNPASLNEITGGCGKHKGKSSKSGSSSNKSSSSKSSSHKKGKKGKCGCRDSVTAALAPE